MIERDAISGDGVSYLAAGVGITGLNYTRLDRYRGRSPIVLPEPPLHKHDTASTVPCGLPAEVRAPARVAHWTDSHVSQHSKFVLAEMATELAVAGAFTDRVITAHCAGELSTQEASMVTLC